MQNLVVMHTLGTMIRPSQCLEELSQWLDSNHNDRGCCKQSILLCKTTGQLQVKPHIPTVSYHCVHTKFQPSVLIATAHTYIRTYGAEGNRDHLFTSLALLTLKKLCLLSSLCVSSAQCFIQKSGCVSWVFVHVAEFSQCVQCFSQRTCLWYSVYLKSRTR